MPIFFIHLHHVIHALTGGFDCLILVALLAPYFAYRVWVKKDIDIKKFIRKRGECHCNDHVKKHKKKK